MSNKIRYNLSNTTYSYWSVIHFINTNKKGTYFLCKCICGKQKIIRSDTLTQGKSKSCGCKNKNSLILKDRLHTRWNSYMQSAKSRNINFNISKEFFITITQLPCYYCNKLRNKPNGIDRKDNKLGYSIENCVSCCGWCNRAKSWDLSPENFILWAKDIAEHHNDK